MKQVLVFSLLLLSLCSCSNKTFGGGMNDNGHGGGFFSGDVFKF